MSFISLETANRMAAVEKKRKQGGDIMGTLTLRDYFAAKAMQTYMMSEVWNPDTYKVGARSAYRVADAMLKEREA